MNNDVDEPYTEADEEQDAYAIWGLMLPLWDKKPVDVELIVHDWEASFKFRFDPATGADTILTPPSEANCGYHSVPGGYFMSYANAAFDSIHMRVWIMTDKRVEFFARTGDIPDASTGDDLWADLGAYVFLLDRPDHNDFERNERDCYTFDPGPLWSLDKLYRLRIHKDAGLNKEWNDWACAEVRVKSDTVCRGGVYPAWMTATTHTLFMTSQSPAAYMTAEESDSPISHFTVFCRTADAHEAGTYDSVYISFLNGNNDVIAKYILRDFLKPGFVRANINSFWLEKQVNVNGFTSKPIPKGAKLKDIAHIVIEKQGLDDWKLSQIEVWANDKLICQQPPSVPVIGGASNVVHTFPGAPSKWEMDAFVVPKKARFTAPLTVTPESIVDVPGKNVKARRYKVESGAEFFGFTGDVKVRWTVSPSPSAGSPLSVSYASAIQPKGKTPFSGYIYLNHNFQPYVHNEYVLELKVSGQNGETTLAQTFSLPPPALLIEEQSFSGGDKVELVNGQKSLVYSGDYSWQQSGFGVAAQDVQVKTETDAEATSRDNRLLRFVNPRPRGNFKYDYHLAARASDKFDVDTVAVWRSIRVPQLDGMLATHRFGNCTLLLRIGVEASGGTDFSYIVEEPATVGPKDVEKEYGASSGVEKVGAVYDSVLVIADLFTRRGDSVSSEAVVEPKLAWTVKGAPYKPLDVQSAVRAIVVDMSNVGKKETAFVTCKVVDAIGQTCEMTDSFTRSVGMTSEEAHQHNRQKAMAYVQHMGAAGAFLCWRGPFPFTVMSTDTVVDPAALQRLPADRQKLVKSVQDLLKLNLGFESLDPSTRAVRNEQILGKEKQLLELVRKH